METRVRNLPVIGNLIDDWDSQIRANGLPESMRWLLSKAGHEVESRRGLRTTEALRDKPVLVVSDHPGYIDPITLLAALPDRDDIFVVGNTLFQHLSPAFDEHLVPMYVKHHMFAGRRTLMRRVAEKIHIYPDYPVTTEEWKSIKSVSVAAKKIDNGGLVAVFPLAGRDGRDEQKWYPGVGLMVTQVRDPIQASVIFARNLGTSPRNDLLRVVPIIGNRLPQLRVDFSDPRPMTHFLGGNPRQIVQSLQREYERWTQRV